MKKRAIHSENIDIENFLAFENFIVRTDPDYRLSAHLDTDEGNAVDIEGQGWGEIVD